MSAALDPYQLAARTMREAVRDKSYRVYPLGQLAGEYLRYKRGRMTKSTYETNESFLDKLAREFPDLEILDFEPPIGTQRLEEFLDRHWGDNAPRTYNKNLSMTKEFFKWCVLRGRLHGDPSLPLVPHKKRDVHREIFGQDDRARIMAEGPHTEHIRRDRVALHLLLKYGIRKGALQHIQFRHFDSNRRRLTIFTKGAKIRELPIPDAAFWSDLEKLAFEIEAQPHHHLLCQQKVLMKFRGYDPKTGKAITERMQLSFPEKPMGSHGLHKWWYGCLQRAGIVAEGVTSGEKMHKARHTAGQRVLDATGNLKAVQKLLGHASIQTTADIYTDWDIGQLEETLRGIEE